MADYINVQHGDLDDAAAITVLAGHENLADYVGYGLEFDPNFTVTPETVAISEGKVFLMEPTQNAPGAGHDKHECLLVAHYDARTKDLVSSTGLNYIWARFNLGVRDSPKIDVTDTSTPPSTDSIRLGTIDAATEEVTLENRDPNGDYETLTAADLDIGNQVTWPDGETTSGHPLTFGEDLDNYNAYYDATAPSPQGTVASAESAAEADWASQADYSKDAGTAGDADTVDGYHAQELLDASSSETTAGEWEPLLTPPIEWEVKEDRLNWTHYFNKQQYDRYKVRIQVDNYNPWIDALYLQLNNIRDNSYRTIDLEAAEYKDSPEKYDEVRYQRRKHWVVGDVMANAQAVHEFYLALPEPVRGKGNGPSARYPTFHTGIHNTGTIRTYHQVGYLTKSFDKMERMRIFSDHEGTAFRAQIYGQNLFDL